MEEVDSLGQPAKLLFTSEAAKRKSIFSSFTDDLVDRVSRFNLTMENHKVSTFGKVAAISHVWRSRPHTDTKNQNHGQKLNVSRSQSFVRKWVGSASNCHLSYLPR